ncbi:hypothetical protein [Dyadobacter sp. CY356]|nr:hypothetical protein [Dyadobacter sp. CY356]MCF0058698.1 hypothetical protein [Dyadobacter sp. CY356]
MFQESTDLKEPPVGRLFRRPTGNEPRVVQPILSKTNPEFIKINIERTAL